MSGDADPIGYRYLMQKLYAQLGHSMRQRSYERIQTATPPAKVPHKPTAQRARGINDRPRPSSEELAILKTPFTVKSDRLGRHVLDYRPPGAPSILDEFEHPKIAIYQHQAPGDALMLTAAVRDLMHTYPGRMTVDIHLQGGGISDMLKHTPYLTPLNFNDPSVLTLHAEYPLVRQSNQLPFHFIHAFRMELERKLGLGIQQGAFRGDVHLSRQEISMGDPMAHLLGPDRPYWLIDAGYKHDITLKKWALRRHQAVVDALPAVTFVQIGARGDGHEHPALRGKNVFSQVGMTDMRMLMRFMFWCRGVITPVSFPMHLAAAVPVNPFREPPRIMVDGKDEGWLRPCIVIAGGREAAHWEQYPGHTFLDTVGKLPCCAHGGCWRARLKPEPQAKIGSPDLNDPDKLCVYPSKDRSGEEMALCMTMIEPEDVVRAVEQYNALFEEFGSA